MARYKANEKVIIKSGKYTEYETAVFKKYAGLVSATVEIKIEGKLKEKTIRLSSIEPMPSTPAPGETIRVERTKYEQLLRDVTTLGEAVEELKHRLEELEIN